MEYSITKRNEIIRKLTNFVKAQPFEINGIKLLLNKYTLVPHPNTFQLIQLATEILNKNSWIKTSADVGTGSGIIAITLAQRFPSKKFFASDISKEALSVARKNIVLNRTKNVWFFLNTDKVWLSEYKHKTIDFILSNPPFVGEKEFNSESFLDLYPEVKLEPKSAIVAHKDYDGITSYVEIIKNSEGN